MSLPTEQLSETVTNLPPLSTLGTTTLPAQIHELLEEAIIRGDIAPSSRLHADDIAAHYGVSRIPVREALRSLHEAGWVEIKPRYGVYVRDRSATELSELFEARSGIESDIAGLAAQRRTDVDLAALKQIVRKGREAAASDDIDALSRTSVEFNSAIRIAAKNGVLAALSSGLEKRARFYFSMVAGRLGGDWLNVEDRLVELIAAGSSVEASAVSRQHILTTGLEVAKLLSDQPPRPA